MTHLFRDTVSGQILRGITSKRVLQFDDETHPDRYIDRYSKNGQEYQRLLKQHNSVDKQLQDAAQQETVDHELPVQVIVDRQSHHHINNSNSNTSINELNHDSTLTTRSNSSNDLNHDHNDSIQKSIEYTVDKLHNKQQNTDPNYVTWSSADDDLNPQNWTLGKKSFVTFCVCFLTFSIYIGSSIYSPGEQDIEQKFHDNQFQAVLGLSLFVLGYAIGPMILAPLSEIPSIGRNIIYIITLAIFVAIQGPTVLATNNIVLWPLRFFSGFFGSPALATGGASISDMWSPKKRAYTIGIWGCAAVLGPVLGPLLGGFAANVKGWTWTIYILMWLSGACWIFLFICFPETSSETILYAKCERLRKLTGNTDLYSDGHKQMASMSGSDTAYGIFVQPFVLLFCEPIVFFLDLYIALIYALLYIWFESFPLVFVDLHNFTLGEEGLAFMGILVGVLIAMAGYSVYLYYYLEPCFGEDGTLDVIEKRLHASMFASFTIPLCLFWFAWTPYPSVPWIVPIIASSFFGIGSFLFFQSVLNYLQDVYTVKSASVLAGNGFLRGLFGFGFPLFAGNMYEALGIGWATSTLGFISVAMIPIPFVLYKYGKTIRQWSKYAQNAD